MFCKKCGNEIADNAAFCNKCGAPTAASPANNAAPVALPGNINLVALILKGVSALIALLTLIFWSGNTIAVSYFGMSQSGPMKSILDGADAGFINVFAIIFYIIALVWSIASVVLPFLGNIIPEAVSKIFTKKVWVMMLLTILTLVLFFFGYIISCVEGRGMNVGFSGLGIFNIILHIAQIVILVLISKENKKA